MGNSSTDLPGFTEAVPNLRGNDSCLQKGIDVEQQRAYIAQLFEKQPISKPEVHDPTPEALALPNIGQTAVETARNFQTYFFPEPSKHIAEFKVKGITTGPLHAARSAILATL